MDPADLLRQSGGIATRRMLVSACGRPAVERAISGESIVAVARGRYALPVVDEAVRQAHALAGSLSHTSAALHHGWAVLRVPDLPHVTVPVKRKVSQVASRGIVLHRGEVDGIATSREVTLDQCLRWLPFDEALAIADSALRAGEDATLRRVAAAARGPGSRQVHRVAVAASPEAANPFESGLRAHGLDVPGLALKPQVLIRAGDQWVRPDLVDTDLGLVVEADSFEWHGGRAALHRDAQRYNTLVADGWTVLRFAWEDVMFHGADVQALLSRVARRRQRACPRCPAA